jgi:hypothetical protein
VKTAQGEKKSRPGATAEAARADGAVHKPSGWEKAFVFATGIWFAISLVKLGNPVIFDTLVASPTNVAEFIFTAWPIAWGFLIFGAVLLLSFSVVRPVWRRDQWPIALIGLWLFWQFLSSTQTIDKKLTAATMPHFVCCVLSFGLGWWALARTRMGALFWTPVLLGFLYTLFTGFDQHNGGLEAMRKAFYEQPNWQEYPKEYLQKISSNRIFGTFVYPNAFAGGILLLLPVCLWQSWALTSRWPRVARGVLVGILGYLSLACLYWTGSKGGWLIGLMMVAVAVLHLNFSRKLKVTLVSVGLVLGLVIFFLRFSAYFQKGATSVGARFTYWSAAVQTVKERPMFGSGPGTFSIVYGRIKPPEAEMAKLAHNDYLEQASDSGIIGGLSFAGFILLSLAFLYPTAKMLGWEGIAVWVGLLGWAAQAFIEFSLYIPGLAWPVFLLFGWLWGKRKGS